MACSKGHPGDTYANGMCMHCDREWRATYRRRRRLGMALLKAAEDRGLSGFEALALIHNADYRTLQKCQAVGIR